MSYAINVDSTTLPTRNVMIVAYSFVLRHVTIPTIGKQGMVQVVYSDDFSSFECMYPSIQPAFQSIEIPGNRDAMWSSIQLSVVIRADTYMYFEARSYNHTSVPHSGTVYQITEKKVVRDSYSGSVLFCIVVYN